MKALLFIASILFFTQNASAARKTVTLNYQSFQSIEEIIESTTDFENTCMRGCRYFSPSVAQIKILDYKRGENEFYIWISVDDLKDYQSFSKVVISRSKNKVSLTQSQVSYSVARELNKESSLPHNPLFKTNDISLELTKNLKNSVDVKFKISVSYGFLLTPLGGKIYRAIKRIADVTKERITL